MGWFKKRVNHVGIVTQKNLIEMKRNSFRLAIQILSPAIFFSILFGLYWLDTWNISKDPDVSYTRKAYSVTADKIPACSYVKKDGTRCRTIGYVPHGDSVVEEIMEHVKAISGYSDKDIISFNSETDCNVYMKSNPNMVQGVYHFYLDYGCEDNRLYPKKLDKQRCYNTKWKKENLVGLRYLIQYNQSAPGYEMPRTLMSVQIPMIKVLEKAIFRVFGDYSYEFKLKKYPHPAVTSSEIYINFAVSSVFAPIMLNLIIQVNALVREKQLKSRQSMVLMGLTTSSYWIAWIGMNVLLNILVSFVIIGLGKAFGIAIFVRNSFITYALLILLFSIAIVPVGVLLSVLSPNLTLAMLSGFFIFLFGLILQFYIDLMYWNTSNKYIQNFFALLPFSIFTKSALDLCFEDTSELKTGLKWSMINNHSYWPIAKTYKFLVVDFFIYLVLGVYFDHMVYFGYSPWFFLTRRYWGGGEKRGETALSMEEYSFGEDRDVLSEEKMIRENRCPDLKRMLVINNMCKTFESRLFCINGRRLYAVKNLYLSAREGEVLCLLGHNGAGKTTVIRTLIGLHRATSGDALVYGNSINTEMNRIQEIMGVCYQHDILWEDLTASEHLEIFAKLKNVFGQEMKSQVAGMLEDVALTAVANVPVKYYSGGMRRRLSVAISLIGDSKIVYLDEPTTGMDPISRQQVWKLINKVRDKRIILLTTHSMEEAEILSDRIAIMRRGRLATAGTELSLKKKYDNAYILTVISRKDTIEKTEDAVAEWANMCRSKAEGGEKCKRDSARLLSRKGVILRYRVSATYEDELPLLFEALEELKRQSLITDVQVHMTTLENVFLDVAREKKREEKKKSVLRTGGVREKLRSNKVRGGIVGFGVLLAVCLSIVLYVVLQRREERERLEVVPIFYTRELEYPLDKVHFRTSVIATDVRSNSCILSCRVADVRVQVRLRVYYLANGQWREHVYKSPVSMDRYGTMMVFLNDLAEGTPYRAFVVREGPTVGRSEVTRFRTAPGWMREKKVVQFGATSGFGTSNERWDSMRSEGRELDFFLLAGDLIYGEYDKTEEEFYARWGETLGKESFRSMSSGTGCWATWNDQEFRSDWERPLGSVELENELAESRRAMVRSLPYVLGPGLGFGEQSSDLYRSFSYGRVAEVFILDLWFERVAKELIISRRQMNWLKEGLLRSAARFKVIVGGVPITDFHLLNVEVNSWNRFPGQRKELLEWIEGNRIGGVLFVSGGLQFGALARVVVDEEMKEKQVKIMEAIVGPVGAYLNPEFAFNPWLKFLSKDFEGFVSTWSTTYFELDFESGTITVDYVDDRKRSLLKKVVSMYGES
ncbi:uncharacterized protein LOC126316685 [Schistocerca gregaria]|uniref:uncharacterized protein LOC126316685 n=1 Tax=Schistocerca gregaria TaxID=7010 RepID=UPI00211DE39B|nr:uncharacterized protein LOC126316685 [Schistocerca gregaria]